MKQIVMAGGIPYLPEEMIRNILIRVPVKSLFRFQFVCKHWRNLINTPSFVSEHLHHSTHQNPSLLFQRNGLWLLDCKMQLHKVDNVPLIDPSNTFRIVGSSNGLLCVEVDTDCTYSPNILLWNPATREVRQLPPNPKGVQSPFDIGFGFSPIVNDYKIVLTYDSERPYEVPLVAVYSLSSGSWKEVEFGIENIDFSSQSVTVNGVMFRFGYGWEPDTDTSYIAIVSFDIASEVFTLIPTPDWSTSKNRLTVYENKLAVLSFSAIQDSKSLIELWVMEDCAGASWAKKYSICLISFLVHPRTIWMNQIVYDGTIASENEHQEWNHEQKITLLNISTSKLKTYDISKFGGGNGSSFILNHAESLLPIGGKKLCNIFA